MRATRRGASTTSCSHSREHARIVIAISLTTTRLTALDARLARVVALQGVAPPSALGSGWAARASGSAGHHRPRAAIYGLATTRYSAGRRHPIGTTQRCDATTGCRPLARPRAGPAGSSATWRDELVHVPCRLSRVVIWHHHLVHQPEGSARRAILGRLGGRWQGLRADTIISGHEPLVDRHHPRACRQIVAEKCAEFT